MQITEIHIYPVKSLAGISLSTSKLSRSGLEYDRQWMVVDDQNRFLTQRTHPQMSLVQTDIQKGGLVLSNSKMETYAVPTAAPDMHHIETQVFNDPVSGVELDAITNEWISDALATNCKLVCFPENAIRFCNPKVSKEGDHTKFADAFPLLVISQASLDDLNSRLETPVGMDRFRPNLVVDDCDAFEEDEWSELQINQSRIRMIQTCSRCSVPTVDQQRGLLNGPEPIHTLSTYRRRNGKIIFGSNYTSDGNLTVSVGDVCLPSRR